MKHWKLVIGLSNPGSTRFIRHNVGRDFLQFLKAEGHANPASLFVPLTFMNLSGTSVKRAMRRHGLQPQDILVVHDDLETPFGKATLRRQGSAQGHNGIRSIIASLGTDHFARLKIGIGRPPAGLDVTNFVLSQFTSDEQEELLRTVFPACVALVDSSHK